LIETAQQRDDADQHLVDRDGRQQLRKAQP
jgi:hypothetical protein